MSGRVQIGILFPRLDGAGRALRAGRLAVLGRDHAGTERTLELECLARPGGRGRAARCPYAYATHVVVRADDDPVAVFDPVRGWLEPYDGADPALVASVAEALRGLGPAVSPPAPPLVTDLAPHRQLDRR